MTADCLQNYAIRLGNSAWCRHWMHWNYPEQDPWLMAISLLDIKGRPTTAGLEVHGFARVEHDGLIVYTIARTDHAGQPFRSLL